LERKETDKLFVGKRLNNNILLRSVTYVIMSPDTDKPMAQAVKNSTSDPIIGNYDILAKDSTGKIIRVT
jgi:hypothetical protein